jgi:hypothetical protein
MATKLETLNQISHVNLLATTLEIFAIEPKFHT